MANPVDPSWEDVEAFVFDVFGTTVDWFTTVTRELQRESNGLLGTPDSEDFAQEWRQGYMSSTQRIAQGGRGTLNVDVMHREILDDMLTSPRWSRLALLWGEEERRSLVMIWHKLDGYIDSAEGLQQLKKHKIVATLSNGNVRLQVDMAKHASLPWDVIFSGELFGSYKPNPKTYLSVAQHLSLPPSKIAMVAAHIYDLRGAAEVGFKTVYVPRLTEDTADIRASVKMKRDAGEVDLVVNSFVELAGIVMQK